MSHKPLVSVIIPAFNAARFLQRTLASALRQTHRNLEILVIDDGSTDATLTLAHAVAAQDSRIRVLATANNGVATARNLGLDAARGDFIAFLDADDLWHPAKLAHQLHALKHDDAALVYPLTRVIDVQDRVLSNAGVPLDGYAFARHLYVKGVGSGSSILVRRQIALDAGGCDPLWVPCEDLDLELKIATSYPVRTVPLFLVGYRVYPGSLSSNKQWMAQVVDGVVEKHLLAGPAVPPWAARAARAATLRFILEILWSGGHRAAYTRALLRLVQLNPLVAADYTARFLARQLPWRQRNRLDPAPNRPLFHDLSPKTGAPERVHFFRHHDRALMAKLEALDAALASQHQHLLPAAKPPHRLPTTLRNLAIR